MKSIFTQMTVFLSLVLGFSGCGVFSGGDDEVDQGKMANAEIVMEYNGEIKVEGLAMTIQRMRVMRAKANDYAAGVITTVDTYNIEVWFNLDGDETEKEIDGNKVKETRYALMKGFRADDRGNFYMEGREPGTKVEMLPDGATRFGSDGVLSYTVDATNGLIQSTFPAHGLFAELSGSTSNYTTKNISLKAKDVTDAGWSNAARISLPSAARIVSRTRYEENVDKKTKAKLACVVQGVSGSDYAAKSYVTKDVELGATIQDKSDKTSGTGTGDPKNASGDDDKLFIQWTEYWYITGFNYLKRTMNVVRVRSAPFYGNRELPGVDGSDTTPSLSGFETLVRACNAAAAASNGRFAIAYLAVGSGITDVGLTFGSVATYCSGLATSDANAVATTAYTAAPSSCTDFTGVSALVSAGTWSGSSHSGPLSTVSSTATHVDMSAITEVKIQ